MNECTAGFDLGTLSAQIATTDTGDATAWDAVNLLADNSSVYDNTHVVATKAAKLVNGNTSGGNDGNALVWSTALDGPLTDYYWRAYVYMEDLPGATGTTYIVQARNSTDFCWLLKIASDGTITILNAGFGVIATFTNTMQTDAWTRFEGHTVHGTGAVEIKLFLDASSETATETQSVTGQTIRANADAFAFSIGSLNTIAWLEELVCGATSYPGPVKQDEHNRFAGPQLLAGTAATVYTTPASGARIDTIHVSNPSGSPVDFTLSIGTDAAGTRLWDGYSIPADSVWERQLYLPLANGEIVQSFASTAGVLVLTLDGKTL